MSEHFKGSTPPATHVESKAVEMQAHVKPKNPPG